MLDRRYWRAVYNEERDGFVVEQAGWIRDEPNSPLSWFIDNIVPGIA